MHAPFVACDFCKKQIIKYVLEQRETGSSKGVGKIMSRRKNDESTRADKTQWQESKMTTQEEE